MATFTKSKFSASVLGEPIQITATASIGDLVHNLVDGYVSFDEVWLYASNTSSSAVVLTVQLGGVGSSNELSQSVGANTVSLIVPGVPMQGDENIRAYAATTDVINVFGWINQIV